MKNHFVFQMLCGLSLDWQDAHSAWCYPAAIVDAFCVTAGLGWNFVILLDIVLIVCKENFRMCVLCLIVVQFIL